jgi:NhaA family Na+:H+ antiporter
MEPTPASAPPEVWKRAARAARALVTPIQRFLAIEAASGVLLLAAVVIALVWANSSAAGSYEALWHTPIAIRVGSWGVEHSLHFLVNEGLMTIFFFVVGLEIRREIYEGELATLKRAALPLVAALGGVAVPAIIYSILNMGRAGAGGWAIPMATDIAFAVGALTLLGSRAPAVLRVLLLGLAVIDDIIAIIVIAVFFSGGISLTGLAIAAGGLGAVAILRGVGVRSAVIYIVPGICVWAGLLEAGVHPTLAGVALGLVTPVRPWFGPSGFRETMAAHLEHAPAVEKEELLAHLDEFERARREAVSPAERLIHVLHPYVAYAIMPVFALANAGVALGGASLTGDSAFVFLGVVLGLAVGKPIGITLAARLHGGAPRGVLLVGLVGGIGFTMSLFIANLAFDDGPLLGTAKLAVLVGSGISMVVGLVAGFARSAH